MSRWKDDEPVDGAGLPLRPHVEHIAALLDLNSRQVEILVAELRNALVPEHIRPSGRGVELILALADALARREGGR